jgi:SWIM zinc finger
MNLTIDQIIAMAPDPSAAAAGKGLMAAKHWLDLGRSAEAIWGRCQGSSVYQVKVDLSNLGYNCTCPSRKFPCKHVLGMLLFAASAREEGMPLTEAPAWVAEWLQKRRDKTTKVFETTKEPAAAAASDQAKQRRAKERSELVSDGIERLDLWLHDLVRVGLAEIAVRPASFWDQQAKRLVDAQAPGLASRVAQLASASGTSAERAQRMLGELGRLQLLTHAYRSLDAIDPRLALEVRQLIGWNVSQAELEHDGERLDDTWIVVGQWTSEQERLSVKRTWVVGKETGRVALILQFAAGSQPFADPLVAGEEQPGTLVFYPGASGQRAKFLTRNGPPLQISGRPPGHDTIDGFLATVADALARQPWLSGFGGVLRDVTVVRARNSWWVRDQAATALPVVGQDHWKALAVTGGHPCDLAGEWDGDGWRILGAFVGAEHWSL